MESTRVFGGNSPINPIFAMQEEKRVDECCTLADSLQEKLAQGAWDDAWLKAKEIYKKGCENRTKDGDGEDCDPWPTAQKLLTILHSPSLRNNEDLQYTVACATRLFTEWTCIKYLAEDRNLDKKTQEVHRSEFINFFASEDRPKQEHIELHFEMSRCRESINQMATYTKKDFIYEMFLLVKNAKSLPRFDFTGIFDQIYALTNKKRDFWFIECLFMTRLALYISSDDCAAFHEWVDRMELHKSDKKKAFCYASSLEDFAIRGNEEIQKNALFRLKNLAAYHGKWGTSYSQIRHFSLRMLFSLHEHPDPEIQDLATAALIQAKESEKEEKNINLINDFEKNAPKITQRRRDLFQQVYTNHKDDLEKEKINIEVEVALKTKNLEQIQGMKEEKSFFSRKSKEEEEDVLLIKRGKQLEQEMACLDAKREILEESISALQDAKSGLEKAGELFNNFYTKKEVSFGEIGDLPKNISQGINNLIDEMFLSKPQQQLYPLPPLSPVHANQYGDDEGIVLSLISCPITKEIMKNPVTAPDGHNYEKDAIQRHLQNSNVSPITKQPLESTTLIPNYGLTIATDEWMRRKGDYTGKTYTLIPPKILYGIEESFVSGAIIWLTITEDLWTNGKGIQELIDNYPDVLVITFYKVHKNEILEFISYASNFKKLSRIDLRDCKEIDEETQKKVDEISGISYSEGYIDMQAKGGLTSLDKYADL